MIKFSYKHPFETTYGAYLKNNKLETELKKYFIRLNNQSDLCYNCGFPDARFYVITGKNDLEKDLPYFELPYTFKNIKNEDSVAIDARTLCKDTSNLKDFRIEDVIKDKYNYNFLTVAGFLTAHVSSMNNTTTLNPIRNSFISAYTALIMSAIDKLITLHPISKGQIEIAVATYAYCLFSFHVDLSNERDKTDMYNTLASKRYSITIPRETIVANVTEILSNVDSSVSGLRRLESFIFAVLPEEYRRQVNINAITELLSKSWFGIGGRTTVLAGLECCTLFISMMYNLSENNFLKKNNFLGMVLDKNEKQINSKEFVRFIKTYVTKNNGYLIE